MFNLARLIYIDPDRTKNATKVAIDSVDLYFHAKPKITGNKSGIQSPGVEIFISPVKDGIPDLSKYVGNKKQTPVISRVEYSSIQTSDNASIATNFDFPVPVTVNSGLWYAVIIKFDGDEDFLLWTAHVGDLLVGTQRTCKTVTGHLFNYVNSTTVSNSRVSGYNQDNWKPLSDTDLKISVKVLETFETTSSTANSELVAQASPIEFVTFDRKYSKYTGLLYGDYIFPDLPKYPNEKNKATCDVVNGSVFITGNSSYTHSNGTTFNWSQLYDFQGEDEYIAIVSMNHDGPGQNRHAVRKVLNYYPAKNALKLDESINFTNAVAYFYKPPVARIQTRSNTAFDGKSTDLLVLTDSQVNSSVRFVNDAISMVGTVISSGGSGYVNSDYVEITGFESVSGEVLGGYAAYANITTNGSGVITNVHFSNTGCGFVNGVSYSIKANTGSASSGSAANLVFTTGSKLLTEFGGSNIYFANTKIINLGIAQVTPLIELQQPTGVTYNIQFRTMYSSANSSNTFSGKMYYVDTSAAATPIDIKNQNTEYFYGNTPVIASRSNQFVIPYSNGAIPNTSVIGTYWTNTAVFTINATSNNSYTFLDVDKDKVHSYYYTYNINNDYTGEHTNYGNAVAKHVTTKIELGQDKLAEDILVYLTAFRPPDTDFKVYARIHNSQDTETFDDKDWTLLEQVDGINVYSNPSNQSDLIELTYNFGQYPNTSATLDGVITTTQNNTTVTGVGTKFETDLTVNMPVRIYSPLFSNTNYILSVVNSITSNTSFELTEPVTNTSVVGSGLKIDTTDYPYQAFNNITTDNVVRYFNTSMVEFDGYDTFQIKVVMLSSSNIIVPKIGDIRAIAVSS